MSLSRYYREPHHATDSEERDVDSTASILLASALSSKAHASDELRNSSEVVLDKSDEWESHRYRREEDGSANGSRVENDGQDAAENEHLLAHETAALNDVPEAAETARHLDGEQPPPAPLHPEEAGQERRQPVSWSSLPKKSQLAILTLARLSEPLTQTSLQAYMFYQLKSFHAPDAPPPSDAVVARQAGMLAAAFTGAQFLVAMLWGRLADSEAFGRKRVILFGLLGTAIGTLGFGFSGSFGAAVFWRGVAGVLNGNMGVMRTMISEIVREKKYQSRAFLLLPMTFNVGVIVGPLLGGLLADPGGSYPGIFGPGGSIGGEKGVVWLMRWPYALPNVVNATFLTCSALGVLLGLEETLEGLRDKPDYGLRFSRWVLRTVLRQRPTGQKYVLVAAHEGTAGDVELSAANGTIEVRKPAPRRKLAFRRIWTSNLLLTLLAHGLLAMHVGTFNSLWFVFLSTPRYTPGSSNHDGDSRTPHLPDGYKPHLPFTFTGGLALPPPSIGTALAIMGVIGISLQLLLYPRLSFHLGTQASFRYSLLLFPISYTLAPYLATTPSRTAAPHPASGFLVWAAVTLVLCFQVLARTFALPSTAILVNNASPHPSVLGTVHGIAQSVSSATRTVGPVLAGWLYGVGLGKGVVGLAWWCMAGVAVVGALAGRWVREGDGHEIWLDGEVEEEAKG